MFCFYWPAITRNEWRSNLSNWNKTNTPPGKVFFHCKLTILPYNHFRSPETGCGVWQLLTEKERLLLRGAGEIRLRANNPDCSVTVVNSPAFRLLKVGFVLTLCHHEERVAKWSRQIKRPRLLIPSIPPLKIKGLRKQNNLKIVLLR